MQTKFTPRLPSPVFVFPSPSVESPTHGRVHVVVLVLPSTLTPRIITRTPFIPFAGASH